MAKYGTKKYWREELHKEEVRFELMCRGFADSFNKSQSIAIEDVQEMVNELNKCSNMIDFNKHNYDSAPENEENEEENEE